MKLFKRKIYQQLLAWKGRSCGQTAVLVEDARRVGKSSIVEEFARNEYESSVIMDFNRPKEGVVEAITRHPDDLDGIVHLPLYMASLV